MKVLHILKLQSLHIIDLHILTSFLKVLNETEFLISLGKKRGFAQFMKIYYILRGFM